MASEFLASLEILSASDKEVVLAAVIDHPLENSAVRDSYVARIVMDADRLDTIGALAPVRCAAHRWHLPLFTGTEDSTTEESAIISVFQDFAVRVPQWYDLLWTDAARDIAHQRLSFLKEFIAQFRSEATFMLDRYQALDI